MSMYVCLCLPLRLTWLSFRFLSFTFETAILLLLFRKSLLKGMVRKSCSSSPTTSSESYIADDSGESDDDDDDDEWPGDRWVPGDPWVLLLVAFWMELKYWNNYKKTSQNLPRVSRQVIRKICLKKSFAPLPIFFRKMYSPPSRRWFWPLNELINQK